MFSAEKMLLKRSAVRARIFVNIYWFRLAGFKGQIVCKGGKGIRQEKVHAQGSGAAVPLNMGPMPMKKFPMFW